MTDNGSKLTMSDKSTCISERMIGSSVQAHVLRYGDNDILIHDSEQVKEGYENKQGSVVLSWNQLEEFTTIVEQSSHSHAKNRVENIEVGKEWVLGNDEFGMTAIFERNMVPEFYFEVGDEDGVCLLTTSQAQDFYEFLVETGYDDLWGIKP